MDVNVNKVVVVLCPQVGSVTPARDYRCLVKLKSLPFGEGEPLLSTSPSHYPAGRSAALTLSLCLCFPPSLPAADSPDRTVAG